MADTRRLRRARAVIAYWRDGELVIENFLTGMSVSADPLTIGVLNLFEKWRSPAAFCRSLPQYTPKSLTRAVRDLHRNTLLVRHGSPAALRDSQFASRWATWLPHAGAFHFATKDTPYETAEQGIDRIIRNLLARSPQPGFFKHYRHNPCRRLPAVGRPQAEFTSVLLRRRTHREFSAKGLSLQSLSEILFYTWGVTGRIKSPLLGNLLLKTSPSAGARHPVEVYVLALNCDGLRPGLYHYAPRRHTLCLISSECPVAKAIEYCAGQRWVAKAAALFLMTAVFPRVMWKYPVARAYRTVLLDAGHLCQTFCLVATWMRLAPFCTAALKDTAIERDLGIDGITESVIYVAGVGVPPPRDVTRLDSSSRLLASM